MSNTVPFSVYQIDIIHYDNDLMDYLAHEFKLTLPASFGNVTAPQSIRL